MPSPLALDSPAKVNLALSVGSPRTDGLHPIASWMVAVHFRDTLRLEALDSGPSVFDRGFAPDAPRPQAIDWPPEADLTFRAHALLERHVARPLPVRVALEKRVPAGAGLGGGSGNAAAVLVGLNRLFDLRLDTADLTALARELGSDVAFFLAALTGRTSMIVTGLGDALAPAPLDEPIPLVLIFPPFGCPTGEVYRALDRLREERGEPVRAPDEATVRRLAALRPVPQDGPFNDLTDAACAVRPALRGLIDTARASLGLPVHVTGSGSALFVIAPSLLTAKVLARKVTATVGLPAVATRTVG